MNAPLILEQSFFAYPVSQGQLPMSILQLAQKIPHFFRLWLSSFENLYKIV